MKIIFDKEYEQTNPLYQVFELTSLGIEKFDLDISDQALLVLFPSHRHSLDYRIYKNDETIYNELCTNCQFYDSWTCKGIYYIDIKDCKQSYATLYPKEKVTATFQPYAFLIVLSNNGATTVISKVGLYHWLKEIKEGELCSSVVFTLTPYIFSNIYGDGKICLPVKSLENLSCKETIDVLDIYSLVFDTTWTKALLVQREDYLEDDLENIAWRIEKIEMDKENYAYVELKFDVDIKSCRYLSEVVYE
jgi:hypothetical protein